MIVHLCTALGALFIVIGLLLLAARRFAVWQLDRDAANRLRFRSSEDELGRCLRQDAIARRVCAQDRVVSRDRW